MARRNRGSSRPRYQWIRNHLTSTEFANAAVQNVLSIRDSEVTGEGLAAPTLVRIRGSVYAELDPATTSAFEAQQVAVGIIVVPDSVSSTEVAGPLTNSDLLWMWWKVIDLSAPGVITANGVNVFAGNMNVEFDVKAMRKWHKSSLLMIAEVAAGGDAHVFMTASWSCLFQE